jgi:hypothetical protein
MTSGQGFNLPAPAPARAPALPAPALPTVAGAPDLNTIMQMLVAMDTRLVSMDTRITASFVAMDSKIVAMDQKIDKIDEKTNKIQENVEALLKSNSSYSSELRMFNAELCGIVWMQRGAIQKSAH